MAAGLPAREADIANNDAHAATGHERLEAALPCAPKLLKELAVFREIPELASGKVRVLLQIPIGWGRDDEVNTIWLELGHEPSVT
jgi:hypothetical protein